MNLDEMMKIHRRIELNAIYKFIDGATNEEIASIIAEIRTCHDNIFVFNEQQRSLDKVDFISINGDCIQLNLEQ